MTIKEKISEISERYLPSSDYFLVDVKVSGSQNSNKVTILVDSDREVSIDDCAEISRKVGNELEERELIEGPYTLEVSSPGVGKPLIQKRQYSKNIGRKLSVILNDSSLKEGTLEEVKEDRIVISPSVGNGKKKKAETGTPLEIPFSDIKKSKVLVSFK